LIADLRDRLGAAGDPAKAAGMRAYLKSELPCYGVYTPQMKRIWREVIPRHPLPSRAAYEATVFALWDQATHREERYAALAVTEHKLYRPYQDPAAVPLYDHLVVTGAWWDLVDVVATRRIGRIRRSFPAELDPLMRRWADDSDLWRRRTAVICQVGGKADTDTSLLTDVLEPNLDRREFFLRKAVGWALRDYSWTDPDWVRAYVVGQHSRLSPLSLKEATRRLAGPLLAPSVTGE
jgi:3-methyladenine DNA glycosylase AlkD